MSEEEKRHQEFSELVRPQLRSLKNTSFRLTRNLTESEDLLQESLLKAYRGFATFQANTNFRAWIFRILVNSYLTHYRKVVRQPQKVSYNDTEEFYLFQNSKTPSDYYDHTVNTISGEMFEDEVYSTLKKMPSYFRIVIMLYDVEGFSYKEISEIIDIPVGTVMSRLNRGRSLIREKLKRYAKEKGYTVETNSILNNVN